MKRSLIALMLCVLLAAVLAGCGGENPPAEENTPPKTTTAALDPTIAEVLNVSEDMSADLASCIQNPDQATEQEHAALRIIQTFGNTQELYVLLEMTVDETMEFLPGEGTAAPGNYTILGQGENKAQISESRLQVLSTAGNTARFLCYFLHDRGPWPEGDLQLTMESPVLQKKEDPTQVYKENFTLTWTPTNQGTILSGDIVTENGITIGDVTLSSFSMQFSLDSTEKEEFFQVTDTIALVYQDGSAEQFGAHFSGRGPSAPLTDLSGEKVFLTPKDISQVTAVQIDGHTVTF